MGYILIIYRGIDPYKDIYLVKQDIDFDNLATYGKPVLTFKESGNTNISFTGEYATLDKGFLYTFWKYDYSGSFLNHNYGDSFSRHNKDIFLGIFRDKSDREMVVPVCLCGKEKDGWYASINIDQYEMTDGCFWFYGDKYKFENGKMTDSIGGIWRISKSEIAQYLADKLEAPLIVGKNKSDRKEFLADTSLIQIISSNPDAELKYTLDGSNPDENSPLYHDPLLAKPGMTIKAKAFRKGLIPSDITIKTFIKAD